MKLNLPNALSLLRIFLVPFLVVVLLTPPSSWPDTFGGQWRDIIALVIFLIATATDFLDGWLARRRGQITKLGTLLDPIADKLLISAAFISLVEMELAPAWMVVVVVAREFAVSGLRSIASAEGIVIAASGWGKTKMVTQITAISLSDPFESVVSVCDCREADPLGGRGRRDHLGDGVLRPVPLAHRLARPAAAAGGTLGIG